MWGSSCARTPRSLGAVPGQSGTKLFHFPRAFFMSGFEVLASLCVFSCYFQNSLFRTLTNNCSSGWSCDGNVHKDAPWQRIARCFCCVIIAKPFRNIAWVLALSATFSFEALYSALRCAPTNRREWEGDISGQVTSLISVFAVWVLL